MVVKMNNGSGDDSAECDGEKDFHCLPRHVVGGLVKVEENVPARQLDAVHGTDGSGDLQKPCVGVKEVNDFIH